MGIGSNINWLVGLLLGMKFGIGYGFELDPNRVTGRGFGPDGFGLRK